MRSEEQEVKCEKWKAESVKRKDNPFFNSKSQPVAFSNPKSKIPIPFRFPYLPGTCFQAWSLVR